MSADNWLAWLAIGMAAGLASMIWAFRRGLAGVLANLGAGVAGAIVGGIVGHLLLPHTGPVISGMAIPGIPAPAGPPQLFFSAVGAILALIAIHLAWNGIVASRRRHEALPH
jgi:uncharacterized membrane protein YeaQ/YmgE (transglycosylase-associated protein family)